MFYVTLVRVNPSVDPVSPWGDSVLYSVGRPFPACPRNSVRIKQLSLQLGNSLCQPWRERTRPDWQLCLLDFCGEERSRTSTTDIAYLLLLLLAYFIYSASPTLPLEWATDCASRWRRVVRVCRLLPEDPHSGEGPNHRSWGFLGILLSNGTRILRYQYDRRSSADILKDFALTRSGRG